MNLKGQVTSARSDTLLALVMSGIGILALLAGAVFALLSRNYVLGGIMVLVASVGLFFCRTLLIRVIDLTRSPLWRPLLGGAGKKKLPNPEGRLRPERSGAVNAAGGEQAPEAKETQDRPPQN